MEIINNGESGSVVRGKINDNFDRAIPIVEYGELPIWQRINIEQALVRSYGYFFNTARDKNFVSFNFPDTHCPSLGTRVAQRLAVYDRIAYFIKLMNRGSFGEEYTAINNACVNGDIISNVGTPTKANAIWILEQCAAYILTFPVDLFFTVGNHDYNSEDSKSADIVLSKQDLYDAVFSVMRTNIPDIVMPENKNYWYKDYIHDDYKIRYIGLDVTDWPEIIDGDGNYTYGHTGTVSGTEMGYLSQYQIEWLCDEALNLPSADYHVILNNHNGQIPWDIVNAFVNNTSVNYVVDEGDVNLDFSVNRDFSIINGFAGVFVANFKGHTHEPTVEKEGPYSTYWVITNSGAGTGDSYARYMLSDQAEMNVIDYNNKKIICARYGLAQDPTGLWLPFGDRGVSDDDLIEY